MRAACLLVLLAGCGASEPCFTVEARSGWQRVPLPAGAHDLAAPDDIEQFRSDEEAIVWDSPEIGGRGSRLRGSSVFHLASHGEDALSLEFAQPLSGARVDALLDDVGEPLMMGKRISGRTVRVEWTVPGDHVVQVRVHRHLRSEPVLESLRRGRRTLVRGPSIDYRMPGSLYVRARGSPLTLCTAPGRTLAVSADSLGGPVQQARASPRRARGPLSW
jgi:hypothetical protein